MVKLIGLMLILSLYGCGHHHNVRTETVEVLVPVFQCPASINNINRPERPQLLIQQQSNSIGELVKQYKISIRQLMNYSEELEKNVDAHQSICETYNEQELTDETQ